MSVPPRPASWLLRRMAASTKRSEVEGDLLEAYESWQSQGRAYAQLRFWREVLLIPVWRIVAAWREKCAESSHAHMDSAIRDLPARRPSHATESLQPVAQDIRYGVRTMLRSPSFAVVSVLILGLGIGANTTMFTLVNSLFMQAPPSISKPDELVGLTLQDAHNVISYFS